MKLNPDKKYWSMDRVSALVVGNYEIRDKTGGCRWTRQEDVDGQDIHPQLNLSYEQGVRAKDTVCIYVAYSDNFIELVGSLEQLSIDDPINFNRDTTFYWFVMFANNQWLALHKPYERLASALTLH